MNRANAYALMGEYTKDPSLVKHMTAVEVAMRAYARKLGEDEENGASSARRTTSTTSAGPTRRTIPSGVRKSSASTAILKK